MSCTRYDVMYPLLMFLMLDVRCHVPVTDVPVTDVEHLHDSLDHIID